MGRRIPIPSGQIKPPGGRPVLQEQPDLHDLQLREEARTDPAGDLLPLPRLPQLQHWRRRAQDGLRECHTRHRRPGQGEGHPLIQAKGPRDAK